MIFQGSFNLGEMKDVMIMSDILYNSAKSFDEATKYNYIFYVARSQKQFVINLNCLADEFTHIMGLDHLKDIRILSSHNLSVKTSAFQRILSQEINFSDIVKSDFFSKPFPRTYNSNTKLEYTLTERLSVLQNIGNILDRAHTGKLYKWDVRKATIEMPNGKTRHTNIDGDYMLAIPSERNPDEKIYLFFYKETTAKKTVDNKEQLYLFSAFADCLDLSRGQERPYTILQEIKENAITKESEVLYTHPSYKKELEQHTAVSQPHQNDNIKQIKFDSPVPQKIVHTNSGTAAAVLSAPNPLKDFLAKLRQSIAGLFKPKDKLSDTIPETSEEADQPEKEIISEEDKTADTEVVPEKHYSDELSELIKVRERFAAEEIELPEYGRALGIYLSTLKSKEMCEQVREILQKQLSECSRDDKRIICINTELRELKRYSNKKFSPHPKQTLDDLIEYARVEREKRNNEAMKDKPEEKQTAKSNDYYER